MILSDSTTPGKDYMVGQRSQNRALHVSSVNHSTHLVLETCVLSLGIFTDDGKVDITVTGRDTRDGLAQYDGRVDVELLTHGDVPRRVTRTLDGSVEDT
jgi:hypothetical protein